MMCMDYACFMTQFWNMQGSTSDVLEVLGRLVADLRHACILPMLARSLCVIQYRYVPCTVLVYSMHMPCMLQVHSMHVRNHEPCMIQVHFMLVLQYVDVLKVPLSVHLA